MGIPATPSSGEVLKGVNWCVTKVSKIKLNDAFFKQLGRIATEFRKNPELYTSLGKRIKEVKEVTQETSKMKKLWDSLLEPFKKVGGQGQKAAGGIGSLIATIAGFGGIAAILAIKIKIDELTQEQQDTFNNVAQADLSKAYSLAGRGIFAARKLKSDVKEVKLENQRVRDRIYGLEKQIVPIREKSNDTLYEVRVGRKILDAGITAAKKAANDALAEGRSFNTKNSNAISKLQADFNKYIGGVKDGFQARIEATVDNLRKGLAEAQSANKQANQSISKANDSIGLQAKIISSLQDAVKLIKPPAPTDTKTITNEVIVKVKEFFNPQLNKIPAIENKVIELSSANSTLKINVESFRLAQSYIDAAQNNKSDAIAGGVTNLATAINQQNDRISKIQNGVVTSPVPELAKAVEIQQSKVQKIEIDLNNLKTQNTSLRANLGGLDTKIKDINKMDIEANRKLDQMLPLISLMPQNTANAIKPNIPTSDQITAATGTAICNSAQGGCLKNALDSNANDIKSNSNANKDGLLDAFNAGSNVGANAQLVEVLDRLGDKIPGGLSGKLIDGFKWLHLDRVLNILILIATIQNHLMLSNDIGQTLLGAINNGLTLIGLKLDAIAFFTDVPGEFCY